jgi:hypothetical protein
MNLAMWMQDSQCSNSVTILISDNDSWLLTKYIDGFDYQIFLEEKSSGSVSMDYTV